MALKLKVTKTLTDFKTIYGGLMMKQTTLLVLAVAMSSVSFAQVKKGGKETKLSEIKIEAGKQTSNTGAVATSSAKSQLAQKAAKEIGNGAVARELEVMMDKVPEMTTVVETLATTSGKENEKFILAHAGRARGTGEDATLDNAGVKKIMTNLHQVKTVFGERGDILVAEMRKGLERGLTMNEALRAGLDASKGRKLSKAEADKVVRKDLVECK